MKTVKNLTDLSRLVLIRLSEMKRGLIFLCQVLTMSLLIAACYDAKSDKSLGQNQDTLGGGVVTTNPIEWQLSFFLLNDNPDLSQIDYCIESATISVIDQEQSIMNPQALNPRGLPIDESDSSPLRLPSPLAVGRIVAVNRIVQMISSTTSTPMPVFTQNLTGHEGLTTVVTLTLAPSCVRSLRGQPALAIQTRQGLLLSTRHDSGAFNLSFSSVAPTRADLEVIPTWTMAGTNVELVNAWAAASSVGDLYRSIINFWDQGTLIQVKP
jgi:hypothetical protein